MVGIVIILCYVTTQDPLIPRTTVNTASVDSFHLKDTLQ
uniref:Uncharacterized protein n=1 Tax=Anguilla anguilla TaxID=7936 RepID=A0A0E9QJD7_ANGAN